MFASPLITEKIFPIVFQWNTDWEANSDRFWEEYNYVMQSLNLYYLVLAADFSSNIVNIHRN